MNKLLLFFLFLFSSVLTQAQNWNLFQSAGLYHFNASNIQSCRIDSVHSNGNDSIYYFNFVLNDSMSYDHYLASQFNQVASYLKPNFFGKRALVSTDSIWLETQELAPVLILPRAALNHQWTLVDFGDMVFKATVDSLYTDSIQGQVDSLRRISISAFDSLGNGISHAINQSPVLISKNNGIIHCFNFYHIKYHGTGLLGEFKREFIDLKRTRAQVFDYQTGDEYHLRSEEDHSSPTNPYPSDFLNVNLFSSSTSRTGDTIQYSYSTKLERNTASIVGPPLQVIYHKNFSQDSIQGSQASLSSPFVSALPGEFEFIHQGSIYRQGYSFAIRSDRYKGRLEYTLIDYAIKDTLGTWVYSSSEYEYVYVEGVCAFQNRSWYTGGNTLNKTWNVLIYFKKGPETWGQPRIVTKLVEVEKQVGFSVYPNPSSGLLNIESEIPFTQIEVYDMQGRKLQTFIQPAKQIELPENAGVYFLRIRLESGEVISRKVVRN